MHGRVFWAKGHTKNTDYNFGKREIGININYAFRIRREYLSICILIIKKSWKLCFELRRCIPNSHIYSRKNVAIKRIVKEASENGFTDLVIVHEDRRTPSMFRWLISGPFSSTVLPHGYLWCVNWIRRILNFDRIEYSFRIFNNYSYWEIFGFVKIFRSE